MNTLIVADKAHSPADELAHGALQEACSIIPCNIYLFQYHPD